MKESDGFDFCFWAKLLVAIPALPLIGMVGASLFTNPVAQALGAAAALALAVGAAIYIDRVPALKRKIVKR